MNKKTTLYAFCLVSMFMILGAASLLYNFEPLFDKVNEQIERGETVVMGQDLKADSLAMLLLTGGYVSDPQDAKFIGEWFEKKLKTNDPIENLGAINGKDFKIPADTALLYGGNELKDRLSTEIENLGQDSLWASQDLNTLKSTFGSKSDSTALIEVKVEIERSNLLKVIPRSGAPEKNVIVRITEHWTNTKVKSNNLPVSHESRILGYAKTDEKGVAQFYVPKGHFYSVIPIRAGFQYGQEKGTTNGCLDKNIDDIKFTQTSHQLTPFKGSTYKLLKSDKALIARTPAEYKDAVIFGIAIFIVCWLIVFLVAGWIDKKQGDQTDRVILLALMILSGMGLLTLYGQMLPLTDIFNAYKMVGYIVLGCGLMLIFSYINYLKLFQRYRILWNKHIRLGSSTLVSIAPGYPFLILAILLMVVLRFAGTAPEGSDARVNLFGFFQPSEVVKYILLLFIVFFFIAKGDVIKTFGEKVTTKLSKRRHFAIIGVIVAVIAIVSMLFLAMLKDMGPGLVILVTFILLYSVVRRDFLPLIVGIMSYIVFVGSVYMLTDIPIIRIVAVIVWYVLWIWRGIKKYKTVFESAIFFNTLVSLFLVGGYILRPSLPHMADRLFNRTNMAWSGIFDNAIPQGDQIAQGLWGTAAGGMSGMGLGGGSPYFIPAGHTDLILNSLGEQMGWLGIAIVAVCFYLLISRTAMVAQYSGHRFTLYLCLGIGLLTGVQFLFVALGCVGVIPLSGVPVPFLSYSGTSIVMALGAYGIVLSISRAKGTKEALKSYVYNQHRIKETPESREAKSLEKNILWGMTLFFVGIVFFTAINAYYQLIVAGKTQIRPAITSTSSGLRVLEYNPRIAQIMNMLDRGNIYDRNNILLATSDTSNLSDNEYWENLQDRIGIKLLYLSGQKNRRLKRYYPFGSYTVFMVGDLNNPDIYANYQNSQKKTVPMGFFAETREEDLLRGFETHPQPFNLPDSKYRYNRFVDPITNVGDLSKDYLRDYSALLPALSRPIYRNPWIERFKKERNKRDINLTLDAILQAKIEDNLAKSVQSNAKLKNLKYLRASAVILDATTGDLLTSANYPLPITDSISKIRDLELDRKGGAPSEWRIGSPITERDLGTTYQTAPGSTAKVMTAIAGLQKLGTDAYNQGYEILPFMSVEPAGTEPNINTRDKNRNGGRKTFMENAIKSSSNCYFIMSLNENDLYQELGKIYWNTGVSLANQRPYFFSMTEKGDTYRFDSITRNFREKGLRDYKNYMQTKGKLPANTPWSRGDKHHNNRMNNIQEYTGIAWGQSQLEASPLNMAKVAGIVGNDGVLIPTRYILDKPVQEGIRILDSKTNELLASAMKSEASKPSHSFPKNIISVMGGKTGTPMREIKGVKNGIMNDGWYICYIRNAKDNRVISIALRLERLPDKTVSSSAVEVVKTAILPALRDCGYISY